jgi:predicted Zn-dependent peptidase
MKDYEVIEFPNGIRLIHKENPLTKIAHLGIMLDIGSRDENPSEQGLAHFWEHMAFKGTKKRKAFHIINRLESIGGELNAYTTKEKVCFYSSILSSHMDKAAELLLDITFNSIFPPKQIEKERQVILEEMSLYKDSPEDAIQDEFDELIFKNHPLGMNILGTHETVSSFSQNDFQSFVARNLDTSRIVISSIGNYSIKKIKRIVEKYIDSIHPMKKETKRAGFTNDFPTHQTIHKPISQVHFGIEKTPASTSGANWACTLYTRPAFPRREKFIHVIISHTYFFHFARKNSVGDSRIGI